MPEASEMDTRGAVSRLLMKAQAFFSALKINLDPELYPIGGGQPNVGLIMEEELRRGTQLNPEFVQRHLHPAVERARQTKLAEVASARNNKTALAPSHVMIRQFLLDLKEHDYQGWRTNDVVLPEVDPLFSRDPLDNIRVPRDPDVYNAGGTIFGHAAHDPAQHPSATDRIRSGFSEARKYARGRVVNTLEDAGSKWKNASTASVGLILVLMGCILGLGAYLFMMVPSPVFCGAAVIAVLLISFGLAMVTNRRMVGIAAGVVLPVLGVLYAFPNSLPSIPFIGSKSAASTAHTAPGQAASDATNKPAAVEVDTDKGSGRLTRDAYKVMQDQAKAMEEQAKAITALTATVNQLTAKGTPGSASQQTTNKAATKTRKTAGGKLPSAPDGAVVMLEVNRKGQQKASVCTDPLRQGCKPAAP
jgi:hypothetical protein